MARGSTGSIPRVGTNGVEAEVIAGDAFAALPCTAYILPARMRRNINGMWTVSATVEARIVLPDGRIVDVRQAVRLRGRQVGRRPHRRKS